MENNLPSNNKYCTLHKKNQYEILGNIEKDTTTGWMTAMVRVKEPDGTMRKSQSVTRSKLIQRGISVLAFLYDCEAELTEDDLKIIKDNLFTLFAKPPRIIEQAEELPEKEVFERLKEHIQTFSGEKEIIDGKMEVKPQIYIENKIGYIKTTSFDDFISANKDMGWNRKEVLKMLKREELLITDKDKAYEKKVKSDGKGINYYVIKLSEIGETEND